MVYQGIYGITECMVSRSTGVSWCTWYHVIQGITVNRVLRNAWYHGIQGYHGIHMVSRIQGIPENRISRIQNITKYRISRNTEYHEIQSITNTEYHEIQDVLENTVYHVIQGKYCVITV